MEQPASDTFSAALRAAPGTPSGGPRGPDFTCHGVPERRWVRYFVRSFSASVALAAAGYASLVAAAYFRYGDPPGEPEGFGPDRVLDRFMARYEVVERHSVRVRAPAHITLTAALEQDLHGSRVVRTIFKARELILGSTAKAHCPNPLLAELLSLGWRVLTEVPGREVVLGTVTRPWDADVVFHPVPPDQFVSFQEPGFVKIVVSFRADPVSGNESMLRTETRAVATDGGARIRFRRYWSFVSPGVALIRRVSLWSLKTDTERRAAAAPVEQPL